MGLFDGIDPLPGPAPTPVPKPKPRPVYTGPAPRTAGTLLADLDPQALGPAVPVVDEAHYGFDENAAPDEPAAPDGLGAGLAQAFPRTARTMDRFGQGVQSAVDRSARGIGNVLAAARVPLAGQRSDEYIPDLNAAAENSARQVAGIGHVSETATGMVPWFLGPAGVAFGALDVAGNRRGDALAEGDSETQANLLGALNGLGAVAIPAGVGRYTGPLARRVGARLGGRVGDIAEHVINGAGTGAALPVGDAAVSTADAAIQENEPARTALLARARGELASIPQSMAIGGAVGGVHGVAGGLFHGIDPATTGEAPAPAAPPLARARQNITPDFAEDPIASDQGSTVSGFNADRLDQLNAELGIAPRGTTLAAARAKRYPADGGLSLTNPVALRGRAAFIDDAAPRPNPPGGEATPIMGTPVLPEVANGIQAPDSANGADVPGEATGTQPGMARAALGPDQSGAVPPVLEPARGDAPPVVRAPDAGGVAVPAVPPRGAPAEGRGADAPVAGGVERAAASAAEAPTPILGQPILENRDAGRGGRGSVEPGAARAEPPAPDVAGAPSAAPGRVEAAAPLVDARGTDAPAADAAVERPVSAAERSTPPPSAGAQDLAHLSPAARDYVAGLAPAERALAQSSIDHLRTHPDPRGDLGNLKMVVESGARRAARKALGNPAAPAAPAAARPDPIGKQLWGERSFVGQDVVPTALEARKGIREALTDVQRVLAPQTRGAQAKTAAGIAREHGAELAQRTDRAVHALETARRYFQGQDKAVGLDFIDRIETGRVQATPGMAAFAETIRNALDTRRQEIQALGKGKLAHFIEDYFPHLWKDPEKAGSVFGQAIGKRPLEGGKSFLKKRSIPTIKEGIAAGLEPVSDNPIDLVLLKAREMDKYLLGQRMLAELKGKDLARYVKATESAPEGFAKINDPIATVYGAPTVKLAEHVDPAVYNVLESVLRDLGIKHIRKESIGAGKLGESVQGGDEIRTRNAAPMGVIGHELGHQLDLMGLGKIVNTPELDAETAALADLHDRLPDYFRKPEERTASVVEAYIQAKERMREIAPKTLAAFETFIDQHPKLAALKDIRPSLGDRKIDYEKAHGGLLKMGEYYAPEPVANLLNNYLSPGLRGKSAAFRAFLGVGNVLNQAQLGLSAFHLGFTSFDSASSKWAIAAKWLAAGHPLKALAHFAEAPLAPVTNAMRGSKVLREWMKPGSQGAEFAKIVDAMMAAGGRAKMDAFYHTAAAQKMMDAFRSGNLLGGMLRVVPGTIDLLAKPIMEYVVPRQKLGIFYDMARLELGKLKPEATRDDMRAALGKAWDSVDNRMGQLVYDNLFWNKTAKDLAMASVRSVGWNLGTWRELGGGAIDSAKFAADLVRGKRPEFSHRMAYALMMPAFAGTVGAMVGYLYGQPPKELKDYFFPRTGEKDEKGHDIRMSLPSYMKDVYHIGHDPVGAVTGKVHPALSLVSDMLRNKDFFGAKIRNEDDPLTQQALDLAKYAGKQLVPMGISNASDQNLKPGEKAAAFVGVVRAPKYLSQSKAEMLAQSIMTESFKGEPKTPEQRQHDLDLLRLLRSPKPEDQKQGMAQMEKEMRAGTMSRAAARAIHAQATTSNLEHQLRGLSAIDSLRVWRIATPDERAHIRQEILAKIAQSKSLTTAKRIALAEEVQPGIVNGRR